MTRGPDITGEMIRLRPICANDAEALWVGAQDAVTSRLVGLPRPASRDEIVEWAGTVTDKFDRVDYAITSLTDDAMIGHIMLEHIDERAHRADLRMSMLPSFRGRGYGREAIFRVLEIAFEPNPIGIGLHRVGLVVLALNPRALSLYESFGFVEEGRLRDFAPDDEGFTEGIQMGLLSDEFDPIAGIYQPTFGRVTN